MGPETDRFAKKPGGYAPSFEIRPGGYRPRLPIYSSEISYLSCESYSQEELTGVQKHFADPLAHCRYYQFIGAIVIRGTPEPHFSTFTLWLLDGRRIDSGKIEFATHPNSERGEPDLGRGMYARAMGLLRRTIPDSKVEEASKIIDDAQLLQRRH